MARYLLDVGQEHLFGAGALVPGGAQHGRGVDRRKRCRRPARFHGDPTRLHDAEGAAEEGLRGRGAEADDDLWFDERDLVLEPRHARADLSGVRCLVDSPFRARVTSPLEVFDRVGDVDVLARDSRGIEGSIEQLPGRADERVTGLVLHVARLLAYDHDACSARALAEHGLGADLE